MRGNSAKPAKCEPELWFEDLFEWLRNMDLCQTLGKTVYSNGIDFLKPTISSTI
jgi:hypothetical protein